MIRPEDFYKFMPDPPEDPIRYGVRNDPMGEMARGMGQAIPTPESPQPMPHPSFLSQLLAGIQPTPMPSMHGYEKDRGARMFLSGLTGALARKYGGGAMGEGGGHAGAAPHAPEDPRLAQARLDEILSRIRANDAMAGTRVARKDQIENPPVKVDPYEEQKHRWWDERIAATGRSNRSTGKGGGLHGGKGGGSATLSQKRAQINALAQAEKQRVANNLKAKYRDVYDYNNPTTGTPEGKRIVDAAIARGIAQVEQEHARVLRNLGAEMGMDQGEDAPTYDAPAAAPAMSRAEQMKQEMLRARGKK